MLIDAVPLSELVWSPNAGLSMRYVSSNVAVKKACVHWDTDSFNIMISSTPKQASDARSYKSISRENLDEMQSEMNSKEETPKRLSFLQSHRSIVDVQGASPLKSHEQDQSHTSMDASSEYHRDSLVRIKERRTPRFAEISDYEHVVLQRNAGDIKPPSSSMPSDNEKVKDFHINDRESLNFLQSKDLVITSEVGDTFSSPCQNTRRIETFEGINANEPDVVGSHLACYINTRNLEKGKEKILYDDENCASSANESNGSNDSLESSSSTRLVVNQKRSRGSYSKMSLENKRQKKDSNESFCSGSLLGRGSSFLSWISNITKGSSQFDMPTPLRFVQQPTSMRREYLVPPSSVQESDKSIDFPNIGFSSVFQALYRKSVATSSRNDHNRETCILREMNSSNEEPFYHNDHEASDHLNLSLGKTAVVQREKVNNACNQTNNMLNLSLNIVADVQSEQMDDSCHQGNDILNLSLNNTTYPPRGQMSTSTMRFHEASKAIAIGSPHILCAAKYDKPRNHIGELPMTIPSTSNASMPTFHEEVDHNIRWVCLPSSIRSPNLPGEHTCGFSEEKGTEILGSPLRHSPHSVLGERSEILRNIWVTRLLPKVSSTKSEPELSSLDRD